MTEEKTIWGFTNNRDCSADAVISVKEDSVIVEVAGGCWGAVKATVTVTKDRIVVIDMEGKRHEFPAPWARGE